jgi:hypothetical protein
MDDYMFKYHVERSRSVHENTTYLEIFSYSVWALHPPILLS